MVFSSSLFLFIFLPVVIIGYFVSNDKVKNIWLLLVSLFFYSWGEPKYIVLMMISCLVNYFLGLGIEKFDGKQTVRKVMMISACIINLGLLFVFKYTDFFIGNINLLFGKNIPASGIALPIGISFYTFQIMSYVIDVYRGDVKAQKNICYLSLYISFFPQLIAGPIVRYSDIEKQILHREVNCDKLYSGIRRFMTGFAKKVLIADNVAVTADWAFGVQGIQAPAAWVGMIAYSIQIYFDFSGYSDMAIGIGRMFGFDFNENFNYPYISCSIKEFWRRWHISLSTWFRDYVYIPLGGSRCSKGRSYFNLIAVFFLTGFWHGASWNFIVWGLYYAAFLVLERIFLSRILDRLPKWLQHVYMLLVVEVGWVFFRADTLKNALIYIKALFSFGEGSWRQLAADMNREQIFFIIAGITFSVPLAWWLVDKLKVRDWMIDIVIIVIFLVAIMYMVGSGFSPFLYFRF